MKMLEPATEEQLSEAVRDANGPLKIMGGGTRPLGNPVTGEVLSTAGLSGITLYEPGALTIVAQAGTPMDEIEAALAKENQRLPFEPMDHRALLGTKGVPTIGGVVAANVSGPRRVQAGACRDSLIGVRFVDGSGTAIKNGGRVMKNVTGYDLVKLMAGSYGTLGVLSEVSFKVLPGVDASATLVIEVSDEIAAVSAMSTALGSPFDVTGAAFVSSKEDAGQVNIRLEGFAGSVAYRSEKLQAQLAEFGAVQIVTDRDASSQIWSGIKDATAFSDAPFVARVSIPPSKFSEFRYLVSQCFAFDYQLDWGGGLVWVAASEAQLVQAAKYANYEPYPDAGARAVIEILQSHCIFEGMGHATLVKAPAGHGHLHPFQPEAAPIQSINDGLRAKFDPRGVLNPGLMG